jgi:hypothetical protein
LFITALAADRLMFNRTIQNGSRDDFPTPIFRF